MSEWVIPVELDTGIPLAIAPRDDLPPPGENGLGANFHHAVYPKSRRRIKTLIGRAMRGAREQWVGEEDHRDFHHHFDEYMVNTWDLPTSTPRALGATVLLGAGYIPKLGIRFDENEPEYVELSEEDRLRLWTSGSIKIASEFDVFQFLRTVTVSQKLEHIPEVEIEEFLFSTDVERVRELGRTMLLSAAEAATWPVRKKYLKAYAGHLILPTQPAEPQEFIVDSPVILGTDKRTRKAQTALRQTLATSRGIELKAA